MKKTYLRKGACLALLVLGVTHAEAQLNGVYTIDQGQATAGTNFQTFAAFAAALNTQGVNAPVTVNVTNATYTEQVEFTQFAGASAANKVTINGNGALITFNSATSTMPHVIRLNGADFMTFNNLRLTGTGTYAYPVIATANADNNAFNTCTMTVPAGGTSSNQIPVVFSGSGTSAGSNGPSGSNNIFDGCTFNNGYYGIYFYGNSSGPYPTNNQVNNCTILDFYAYGIYQYYYHRSYVFRKNVIKRPTRTNSTTCAGIYSYYSDGNLVEGNFISNCFDNFMTSTSTFYGIYMSYNLNSYVNSIYGSEYPNIIRNNIVADIRHNGTAYGILTYYPDGKVYNNTVSFNYASGGTSTTYGIYGYADPSYPLEVFNNIVSITRGGTGSKYGFSTASIPSGTTLDRNDLYVNSPSGTNYIGNYSGNATTLAQLQAQGVMASGFDVNPTFSNIATHDFHPTNAVINNTAIPMGLLFDQQGAVRNQQTPDIGALEFLTLPCTGTPSNAIAGAGYSLCPGESAELALANLVPDAGLTYQWNTSTVSLIGPWTPVANATGLNYSTPSITNTVYYAVQITCNAPGGSSVMISAQLDVSNTVTNTVPYYEGFENIGRNNRLPNCSWFSSNQGGTSLSYTSATTLNRLPRSGSSFGAFSNLPAGKTLVYSNGILMHPNITYSATVWYQTDFTGATNWDLKMMLSTSQATAGLVDTLASTNSAVSAVYKALTGTFTVASTGMYYLAFEANGSAGNAKYLSYDDISVIIPCQIQSNRPAVTISSSSTTVCEGGNLVLTAGGGSSYVWNTGVTGAVLTEQPTQSRMYVVTATSSLTGCSSSTNVSVNVKPSPVIAVFAVPPAICNGQSSNLTASGASAFSWNSGGTGAVKNVSPNASTTYTVIGTSTNNCSATGVVAVTVNNLPSITANASKGQICTGEQVTLSAGGANSYIWANGVNLLSGQIVNDMPVVSSNYTVTGTDANGCTGTNVVNLIVDPCAGIGTVSGAGSVRVFPNPASDALHIEAGSVILGVVITDVAGRVVFNGPVSADTVSVSSYAAGVYYLQVNEENGSSVIKFIKN